MYNSSRNFWRITGFDDSSFRVDPTTNLHTNVVPYDVIQTNWKSRLRDHVSLNRSNNTKEVKITVNIQRKFGNRTLNGRLTLAMKSEDR